MKTKFKDFLIYSLAFIGMISLFLSSNKIDKESQRYQISASGYADSFYLLDNHNKSVTYYTKKTTTTYGKKRSVTIEEIEDKTELENKEGENLSPVQPLID